MADAWTVGAPVRGSGVPGGGKAIPPQPERHAVPRCPVCGREAGGASFDAPPQMAPSGPPFRFSTCGDCGLTYLSDRVAARDLHGYYGAGYLPHRGEDAWGAFAPLVRWGRRRTDRLRVRRISELADLSPGDRVLDVGCGRPTFLQALGEVCGTRGVGIDLVADAFSSDPGFQGLELRAGDPREVPLSGFFQAITMWHYLEHDYDPVATLRRLLPFTRRDTVLLVEVPDGRSLARRWAGARWAGLHTPRHTAVYTPDTLRRTLRRGGWEVVVEGLPPTLDPWILWWLSWRERRGTDWTVSMARYFPGFVLGRALLGPVLRRVSRDVLLVAARPVPRGRRG